jgi:hypothetical protein
VGVERFANSADFLEHLNFALGEPTAKGLNTLVAIEPSPINAKKIALGLQMANDEEEHYMRKVQADPSYKRQLHGWVYEDGQPPHPKSSTEYQRAYDLANSLSAKDVAKLIGGYGGERGEKPTGAAGVELAADALYNASYGIDTLTGAPLNYKSNAGHIFDFKTHGQGPTRAEQARVNKLFQASSGLEKLNLGEKSLDDLATAELYARHPEAMEKLLTELPSSNRETSGWEPELKAMRSNAKRWNLR